MLLQDLALTSAAVAATSSTTAKIGLLADHLRRLTPQEVPVGIAFLSGELRQRRTGLGYAALRDLPAPAQVPTLTLLEVDEAFAAMARLAGPGSACDRRAMFAALMSRATAVEQQLISGLVSGELRQGALGGVLTEAVATATETPAAELRRAVTLAGTLTPVAEAVLAGGPAGLAKFRLVVGRPLKPMLAQSAGSLAEAISRLAGDSQPAGVEWKLDGIRIQVHRDGSHVAVFTRTLEDITDRVPEVTEAVLALPARSVVLDGETLALDGEGRPRPFQVTSSRVARRADVGRGRAVTPLAAFFFDMLHVDGEDLVAASGLERWRALETAVPGRLLVPRLVTADQRAAEAFLAEALQRGHEGVLVKSLDVPYAAGRRGAGWIKVKPRHTLDLVVLAAEWGHGRRRGWLSNLHLGARDPEGTYGPRGGFVMLGKTFKGLTDATLKWQTERLLQLATDDPERWVVPVRPKLVVEVAFDGVQTSPRYPAGAALRFARVLRYRPDKSATEADTIGSVLALLAGGAGDGARPN